jgi:hypothetical protein
MGAAQAASAVDEVLLLSRWVHLSTDKKRQLNELFALNRRVMKAYLLKESLDRLWNYTYEGSGRRRRDNRHPVEGTSRSAASRAMAARTASESISAGRLNEFARSAYRFLEVPGSLRQETRNPQERQKSRVARRLGSTVGGPAPRLTGLL